MTAAEEDDAQFEAFERRRAREAAAAQTTRQRAEEIAAQFIRQFSGNGVWTPGSTRMEGWLQERI